MGASEFVTTSEGTTATDAFQRAREEALYESGNGGYSGTIAEKHSFRTFDLEDEMRRVLAMPRDANSAFFIKPIEAATTRADKARHVAGALLDLGDARVDDKWGPAGCFALEPGQWLFFGLASS